MAIDITPLVPIKRFGISSYRQMLINLLPPGRLWNNLGPKIKLLFEAFACELDRIEQAKTDLIRESIPGLSTASSMLPEWESALLLRTELPLSADSQGVRQRIVHAKMIQQVIYPSKDFFISYALTLNIVITIAPVTTPSPFTTGTDTMGTALAPDGAAYYWEIVIVSDPDGNIGKLAIAFKRLKPAHTVILNLGIEYPF